MMNSGILFHALLIFIVGVAGLSSAASAEDWPRWGGPRGDGSWKGTKLPSNWPREGLPVVWKEPIGGGYGGISVVGGCVFVMDRQTQPAEVERVLCVDPEAGKPLWTHSYPVKYGKLDYGNGPRVTTTVFEGKVYTLGAVGHAFCLDAKTGDVVWSKDCIAEFNAKIPTWGLAASPVIWDDLVILHPGAEKGSLMAFDRLTGYEMWRAASDPAGYATPAVSHSPPGRQLLSWAPETLHG